MCRTPSNGDGKPLSLPPDCQTETLGVAFFDLSRIREWASSNEDLRVATFFQRFYVLAAERLEPAGGRLVKFMGDAGLVVFPKECIEAGVLALCDLASEARRAAHDFGLDTYLNVNVHVGPVIAGTFGPPGSECYDVLGKTVNIAARLGRRGITLSSQAYRCLGDDVRGRFEKLQPPANYRLRP